MLWAPALELRDNEHRALIGPGVSGQSTLLRILAGNLNPSEGTVWVDGEALYPAVGRDDRWRGPRVGVVSPAA